MEDKSVGTIQELNNAKYGTFKEIFGKMRALSEQYGGLPVGSIMDAFGTVSGRYNSLFTENPYIQNRRVKSIATRPANYNKEQIAQMLQSTESNEQPIRSVDKALEYTAYSFKHLRMVYQNLLTYHSYIAPSLTDEMDAESDYFWREWKLLEKLRKKLNPKDTCHMICGQALQEGKVFYHPRYRVDKSHNKVDYAFLQQMPSDFIKIVGFNNVSKYTVAFNMMYFMIPGTDWRQFGDLFVPYVDGFADAVNQKPEGLGTKTVYASIDMDKVRKAADPRVEAYYQNGTWCYWVTLPVDKVFPFEIDDTDRNVLPIFTGLFLDLVNLAAMEAIQLELLQNPLVSLLHGEIPYWDNKSDNTADDYKLSNAGRMLFEALWYQMLQTNNTSGIGLYMAPLENMKLETMSEVPNATEIVSKGVQDVSVKTGMAALIPSTSDARAGAVQVSLMIESKIPQTVYRDYERMMTAIIDKLNLNYEWSFHIFGDLSQDADMEDDLRNAMTLGILPATLKYDALHDISVLDDMAISDAILKSKLLDRRIPLVSSYSAKQSESGLPPQAGRPESDGITSDGAEGDIDSPSGA